ncbi:MAG: hypothetical protein EBS53_05200, partial [Bacteroidetes bacterium]|nr:hypothetical protein [Bacteroidota bacterium]
MKQLYTHPSSSLFSGIGFWIRSILLLLAVVLIGHSSKGQNHEVRISSATACIGDTVSMPVSVVGLQGAGAISLVMDYDPSALMFVGINSFALSGTPIINANNGEVRFIWVDFNLNGATLNNGLLLNLRFVVSDTSHVTFDTSASENCEIANTSGVVNSAFQFYGAIVVPGVGANVALSINGNTYAPQVGGHQLYACGRQAYNV